MGMLEQFIELELRTVEKAPSIASLQRQEWSAGASGQHTLLRKAAGWIGDRLVCWGESLRAWGTPRASVRAS